MAHKSWASLRLLGKNAMQAAFQTKFAAARGTTEARHWVSEELPICWANPGAQLILLGHKIYGWEQDQNKSFLRIIRVAVTTQLRHGQPRRGNGLPSRTCGLWVSRLCTACLRQLLDGTRSAHSQQDDPQKMQRCRLHLHATALRCVTND